jgi:hypothetical protein
MTTLAPQAKPPPPDDWKVAPRRPPLVPSLREALHAVKWLRDPQLGPCCMECAPHVISADKLLYFARISVRKRPHDFLQNDQ